MNSELAEAARIENEIVAALQTDFPDAWDEVLEADAGVALRAFCQRKDHLLITFRVVAGPGGNLEASGLVENDNGPSTGIMIPFSGDGERRKEVRAAELLQNVREAVDEALS
jgi:hypothetical protein